MKNLDVINARLKELLATKATIDEELIALRSALSGYKLAQQDAANETEESDTEE